MTSSSSFPVALHRTRFVLVAIAITLVSAACSQGSEVVGSANGEDVTRDDVFDVTDTDDDGVVSRADFEQAVALSDRGRVVATFVAGDITLGDVLDSLAENPPSSVQPGTQPDLPTIVARLTSMLRLRLSAVGLTDLGFAVSLNGTDAEINDVVGAVIDGEFEQFAQDRAVAARPEIIKIASPHCLSLVAVTTEAEALDAVARIGAGEKVFDVALEVNLENTTDPGGGLGCNTLQQWQSIISDNTELVSELQIGELSVPTRIPTEGSPTGELWVIFHVDGIFEEQADVGSLGPFAGGELSAQMQSYDVEVPEDIGTWSKQSLSISLPA